MKDSIAKAVKFIRHQIKPFVPGWALRLYVRRMAHRRRQEDAIRPIKDVFTRIYQQNGWGGIPGEYFSGTGSVDPSVSVYAETIKSFIGDRQVTKMVDLGCGDFKVGNQIQLPGVEYVGVDIVESLVERNKALFGNNNVSFCCMNIITDLLPDADLCLMRQVLQHLSNQEIALILKNIAKYKYVMVTEHHLPPNMHVVPNKEKPHSSDTRLIDGSGVYLDHPPFNAKISEVLLDTEIQDPIFYKGERLTTFLIQHE